MSVDSRIQSRNERDCLTETELDGVVAGADDFTTMIQCLSACMRMLADTQKAVIANIR